MFKLRLVGLVVTALLIAGVLTVSAQERRNFRAHLNAENEVLQVDSQAQGQAIFQLSPDGTQLRFRLIVANINDVIGAHIHLAPAGSNGPIAANLFGAPFVPDPGVTLNGTLVQGVLTQADLIARPAVGFDGTMAALIERLASGGAYVNVHTVTHRPGEIRGQIG
jgi:hypothetical protein